MAASMELAIKKMTDMTECPICTESFKQPRVLPCLHTFCLDCLQKYGKDMKPGSPGTCPVCRLAFTVPRAGFTDFPSNFWVNQLQELREMSLKESNDKKVETLTCEICSRVYERGTKKKGNGMNCAMKLCGRCIIAKESRSLDTRRHGRVFSFEDDDENDEVACGDLKSARRETVGHIRQELEFGEEHGKIAVVVDCGSDSIRAGFAGSESPLVVMPFTPSTAITSEVGGTTQSRREIRNGDNPIQKGLVNNWDDLEHVWHHLFHNELQIRPEEHRILLAKLQSSPGNHGSGNKDKAQEILFETLKFSAVGIEEPANLALYSYGRKTGVVVDIGHGVTSVSPIIDCRVTPVNPDFRRHFEISGEELTTYLGQLLSINYRAKFATAVKCEQTSREIKERFCRVAPDSKKFEQLCAHPTRSEKLFTLTNDNNITVGIERFCCPEALFHPPLTELLSAGIQGIIRDSVLSCDAAIHAELFSNVVLSGGSTLFKGFSGRVRTELQALTPRGVEVKVMAQRGRQNAVFIGGTILAGVKEIYRTRQEYDESGC